MNSPGHHRRTLSKIDHIIISSNWRGSIQDVQEMRNADVRSDHNMLVAKMTLKLRNANIGMACHQRPDISKQKDTLIMKMISITLRNLHSILQDEAALIIGVFKAEMIESVMKTIGYAMTCKSEWISPDTWRTI